MGQFSWLDCHSEVKRNIRVGKKCYVLLPKHMNLGEKIEEPCYDGYGHFGTFDIYELVAEMNRDYLLEDMLDKPALEDFGSYYEFEKDEMRKNGMSEEEIEVACKEKQKENYERALESYKEDLEILNRYKNGASDEEMDKEYDEDWKRDLGLNIACEDDQNIALPYPIKITYSEYAKYESCPPSLSDPRQGR